jgi:hypothetical protein
VGLFDSVKTKANALAADAERAGKITAAQARTIVLQNEVRKSERELGHTAYELIELGEVDHPQLEAAAATLRAAHVALEEKEQEIAALRHEGDQAAPAAFVDVPRHAGQAPAAAEAEAPGTRAAGSEQPAAAVPAADASDPPRADAGTAKKAPAAKPAKKAAAPKAKPVKKTRPRSAAPKKPPAPRKPASPTPPETDEPA